MVKSRLFIPINPEWKIKAEYTKGKKSKTIDFDEGMSLGPLFFNPEGIVINWEQVQFYGKTFYIIEASQIEILTKQGHKKKVFDYY